MSEWTYIALAYAVVWLGLIGYRLYIAARRREAAELFRKEEGRA